MSSVTVPDVNSANSANFAWTVLALGIVVVLLAAGSAQAAPFTELARLGQSERDRFYSPSLKLTRPHRRRFVTHTFAPLVRGKASDPVGVASVRVGGVVVPVGRDGSFATRLRLRHRRNHVAVTVTNLAGAATTVKLTVIYRPRACVVPEVRGLSALRASARLLNRDCRVRIRTVRSRRVAKGKVVAARPGTGTRRRPRTRVTLLVSQGRR